MKTRKVMMKIIHKMEIENLAYDLKIDLMRKASKRFAKRGDSLKVNIVEALIRNEEKQKIYREGILTGYKISLSLMKQKRGHKPSFFQE